MPYQNVVMRLVSLCHEVRVCNFLNEEITQSSSSEIHSGAFIPGFASLSSLWWLMLASCQYGCVTAIAESVYSRIDSFRMSHVTKRHHCCVLLVVPFHHSSSLSVGQPNDEANWVSRIFFFFFSILGYVSQTNLTWNEGELNVALSSFFVIFQ